MSDMVNHPKHYMQCSLECIDAMHIVLGDKGLIDYYIGNAFKYIWRHPFKENPEQDMEKAKWYIDHAVELSKSTNNYKLDQISGLMTIYTITYFRSVKDGTIEGGTTIEDWIKTSKDNYGPNSIHRAIGKPDDE